MDISAQKTKRAFFWTRILDTPFWAIFNMLPFILYKDLHATPFQLAVVIALKPLSSLLSMYWSHSIAERRERLLSNVIIGGIVRHLPFFLFPFINSVWLFILFFGLHMTLARGVQPAWMEILKINIPGITRDKVFAWGSAVGYVGDALLPFALGFLLDGYFQAWRWCFPIAALLSLFAVFFQLKIPIENRKKTVQVKETLNLLEPWKKAWQLIKSRPDFARFQIGFMIAGSGLMIIQPVLPVFFVDVLNLSYTELAVAITFCKGIGFAATSPLWARLLSKSNIYLFTSLVTFLLALFPIFLMLATKNSLWLYIGYVAYGVMQAGSNLSWNLSGPIFSKDEDSSVYSSINVATVGIRALIVPAIGSLIASLSGSTPVMILGSVLCLIACAYLIKMATSYAYSEVREV